MKKWGIIMLIFMFAFIDFNNKVYGVSPVENCFKSAGAQIVYSYAEGKAVIKTDDKPFDVVKKIFTLSGQKGEYSIRQNENIAELVSDNGIINIKISAAQVDDKKAVYVCFTLSQQGSIMNINNIRRTIYYVFSIYGKKPSFCSLILGKYKGIMTSEKMKEIALKILKTNNADFINEIEDRNLVSFCGYIPDINEKADAAGTPVNINIALRNSRKEGCTYIWIGSPVINAEY